MHSKIENNTSQETRVALLEQSIGHINQTLIRIEKRFDSIENKIDYNFNMLNNKIDSNFKWLLTIYLGGYASLFAMLAHPAHWF